MSLFFADLVRETSESVGTSDFALTGALPGHRRFADAVPPGARFHYAIAGATHPDEWETGEGELGSGGTLLRLPLASSAGGAAVNFSPGVKTVALTVAAAWFAGQEAGDGPIGIGEVAGLQAALDGKAAAGHGHEIGGVAGLQSALDGKAAAGHGHEIADVAGLQTALNGKAALAGATFTGAIVAPSLATSGDADVGGFYRIDGVKVVGNRVTGWAAPTGPSSRAAFDSSTVTLVQLAQRVKALIDDLRTHGLIGT